ncbi:MAG: glycosyltransferase, partial [Patescibacteria group bacterium]
MRIVLTGGGTGGHLLPFEPIIASLRMQFLEQQATLPSRLDPGQLEIVFLGPVDAATRSFFSQYDVRAIRIPSGKLRRYASGLTIFDLLWRLPLGVARALVLMYFFMPDAVISLGGYGSVPGMLAAVFYRIPIVLHEMNAVMGLANRRMVRRAAVVTLGFGTPAQVLGKYAYKGVVTGDPVREDIHRLTKPEAKREFHIEEGEHVLLVTGGSQGAKQLNEVLLQILPRIILDTTIIHLTGKDHFTAVSTVAQELLGQSSRKDAYLPFPYLTTTMAHA